jgi:selenocysteine lyase/cysteine desulfurase
MPLLAGTAGIAAALGEPRTDEEWRDRALRTRSQLMALQEGLSSEPDVVILDRGLARRGRSVLQHCGLLSFYAKDIPALALARALTCRGYFAEAGNHGYGMYLQEVAGITECIRVVMDLESVDENATRAFVKVVRAAVRELREAD